MTHTTIMWMTLMFGKSIVVVLHIEDITLTMMISYLAHNTKIVTNAARNLIHLRIAKLVTFLLAVMRRPSHKTDKLVIHFRTAMRMPHLDKDTHEQGLHRGSMIGIIIGNTIKMDIKSVMWRTVKITIRKAIQTTMPSTTIQSMPWMKRNLSANDVIVMRT